MSIQKANKQDILIYQRWFDLLAIKSVVFTDQISLLLADNNFMYDDIDIILRYINGDSIFLTFNRFIKTMQMISLIQQNKISISTIQKEIKLMDEFIFIEYTFVGDPEVNQLVFPLKMYEIKMLISENIQLLKQRIRRIHHIPNEDHLFICNVREHKLIKAYSINDPVTWINRKWCDLFVYHKKVKQKMSASQLKLLKFGDNISLNNCIPHWIHTVKADGKQTNTVAQPFAFPLLINIIPGRLEIKMNELYTRICQIITPFIYKNDPLRKKLDLAVNINIRHCLIFGFIRKTYEEKYKSIIATDLKLLILNYVQFELPNNLPFIVEGQWGSHTSKQQILCNEDTFKLDGSGRDDKQRRRRHRGRAGGHGTISFNVRILEDDDNKSLNIISYKIENRKQVEINTFDKSIPYPNLRF